MASRVALLGFGGVGRAIASALLARGISVQGFDIAIQNPVLAPALLERSQAAGVELANSVETAVPGADWVLAAVPAESALHLAPTTVGIAAKNGAYSMTPIRNYIDGRWFDGSTGTLIPTLNPATGAVLAEASQASAADIARAVEAAAAAQHRWRKVPAPKRAEVLFRVASLLGERMEEFVRLDCEETGKILEECRGEVQEAIDTALYAAGEGRRMFGETVPSELPDKFAMALREPVGVVAAITPWNFPLSLAAWKVFCALICGNAVVLKPSPETPLITAHLVSLVEEAGLPSGVLNLVLAEGVTAGKVFTEHPLLNAISLTGSTATGAWVAERAGRHLKRVALEMGGKNAIIVLDDADLNLALDTIVWSAFGTAGQRCTSASRIIVQRPVVEELTQRLVERVRSLRVGNPLEPEVAMGPLINASRRKAVHSYVKAGRQEGAQLLVGGDLATPPGLDGGFFFQPTVFTKVGPQMRIAQEEIFGPVTCLIPVDTFEQALEVHNGTGYGLSGGILSRDAFKLFRAMREMECGVVYLNAGTIGAEIHLPFGGMKRTGNGHREVGQAFLDFMSEWKSVFVDYSGRLQRAQIDTVAVDSPDRNVITPGGSAFRQS